MLDIVKRTEYLDALGKDLEPDVSLAEQDNAKKGFDAWLEKLDDQKRKKTITDGISLLLTTAQQVEDYLTARDSLHKSLTKLGEGKFLLGMYVAITETEKAKRNSPEDKRWSLFLTGYLVRTGLTRSVSYKRFTAWRNTMQMASDASPTITPETAKRIGDVILGAPALAKIAPSPEQPLGRMTDAVKEVINITAKNSDLNSDFGIKQLTDALNKLQPSSGSVAHTKKEILQTLHNDTLRGIYRACKATEPGFEHGNVERVVNDFVNHLLNGLGYAVGTEVKFKVADELDNGWNTWSEIIPNTKQTKQSEAPPEYSAHGLYIRVSTEDRHSSEKYRVYLHEEGKADQLQKPFRKEQEAKKFIAQREQNWLADEKAAKEAKPDKSEGTAAKKPKVNDAAKVKGASAGA
jgi:hypothetical protein